MRRARARRRFEISITATPANFDTRLLTLKSVEGPEPTPSHAAIERRVIEAGIITRPAAAAYEELGLDLQHAFAYGNGDEREHDDKAYAAVRRRNRDMMFLALTGEHPERIEAADPRPRASGPVQIARFKC